jgi:hypothetical protein
VQFDFTLPRFSKAWRALGRDIRGALDRDASASDGPFVK